MCLKWYCHDKGVGETKPTAEITFYMKKNTSSKKIDKTNIMARDGICRHTGWTQAQYYAMIKHGLITVYAEVENKTITVNVDITAYRARVKLNKFITDEKRKVSESRNKLYANIISFLNNQSATGGTDTMLLEGIRTNIRSAYDQVNSATTLYKELISSLPPADRPRLLL